MRDHNYIDEQGKYIPVSQLSRSIILKLLSDGDIEIDDSDGDITPKEIVLERLRIELVARALEGRE